jgi:hypothetical protein
MNKSDRIKLYEKLYFHELDRREKIAARLSTPLGALIGSIGVFAFLLNSNPKFSSQISGSLFWIVLTAGLFALVGGAWHFRTAWLAHDERHVATAAKIDNYLEKLEEHYKGQPNSAQRVQEDFSQFLLDTFRRSATTNAENNDERSEALHKAGSWLTIAVSLALLSTIPYYLGKKQTNVRQEAQPTTTTAPAATS